MDELGWESNTELSEYREYDYYGQPIRVPPGMSSTRALSGFGTLVGTPHNLGNALWGGTEFVEIKGMTPNPKIHKFHFDVEPITGNVMRIAKRLQYNIRVERGPLMDKIVSSQDRCVAPTSTFNPRVGLGCFIYFPLAWYDDQRVFQEDELLRIQDKYMVVPGILMANTLISVGLSTFLAVTASIIYVWQWNKWRLYKARIFLD